MTDVRYVAGDVGTTFLNLPPWSSQVGRVFDARHVAKFGGLSGECMTSGGNPKIPPECRALRANHKKRLDRPGRPGFENAYHMIQTTAVAAIHQVLQRGVYSSIGHETLNWSTSVENGGQMTKGERILVYRGVQQYRITALSGIRCPRKNQTLREMGAISGTAAAEKITTPVSKQHSLVGRKTNHHANSSSVANLERSGSSQSKQRNHAVRYQYDTRLPAQSAEAELEWN